MLSADSGSGNHAGLRRSRVCDFSRTPEPRQRCSEHAKYPVHQYIGESGRPRPLAFHQRVQFDSVRAFHNDLRSGECRGQQSLGTGQYFGKPAVISDRGLGALNQLTVATITLARRADSPSIEPTSSAPGRRLAQDFQCLHRRCVPAFDAKLFKDVSQMLLYRLLGHA